jgi:hypothetical protein
MTSRVTACTATTRPRTRSSNSPSWCDSIASTVATSTGPSASARVGCGARVTMPKSTSSPTANALPQQARQPHASHAATLSDGPANGCVTREVSAVMSRKGHLSENPLRAGQMRTSRSSASRAAARPRGRVRRASVIRTFQSRPSDEKSVPAKLNWTPLLGGWIGLHLVADRFFAIGGCCPVGKQLQLFV